MKKVFIFTAPACEAMFFKNTVRTAGPAAKNGVKSSFSKAVSASAQPMHPIRAKSTLGGADQNNKISQQEKKTKFLSNKKNKTESTDSMFETSTGAT